MMYGMDWLGLARYPAMVEREHPAGWALGCFAEIFGDARPALERVLATNRVPLVRVHLIWSDAHEYGDKDLSTLQRLASQYEELARKFPSVAFELSPFCEHKLQNPDKYLRWVKHYAPSCVPVNTPWTGAVSRRFKNEIHGTKKAALRRRYNFSFDGDGCVDSDVTEMKKRHSKASVFWWWTYQFNGRKNDNDPTPREEREAWPTADLIDSVIYLKNDRGSVKLPPRWLWKSHADQHAAPVPEPRALKPVLICPVKLPSIELVAENGQVVTSLPYYGPFGDGRHRYYASTYGFWLAEKAIRIQGKPVCKLIGSNGITYGRVNPAFRAGEFR